MPREEPAQASLMDFSDTKAIPKGPQGRYKNPLMHSLSWAAHDYLYDEGALEDFIDVYHEVKRRFQRYESQWPELEGILGQHRIDHPEDAFPDQASYLSGRGRLFYQEGFQKIESFLHQDGEDELLLAGVRSILDGSDHLTLCLQLSQQLTK